MFRVLILGVGPRTVVFRLARDRIRKTISTPLTAIALALTSVSVLAQQKPMPPPSSAGIEFPVVMRQKVSAGKTPVGTRIRAKLVIATLVNGAVIPEGAILSGEVTESAAKSVSLPSRLGVRMDSAQWKNGSISIRAYLTAWYYPVAMPNQDQQSYALTAGASPRSVRRRPPGAPPGSDADEPTLPAPSLSQHRALLKNVESTRNSDGVVILTSEHSNLKLDKGTTYVLAAAGLLPAK
jgi:hypothetical protein